ncbi:NAD(P)H-dependent oxidoreductase [bacterium]|nr:NAD(P)H-dependent oxidoreductase [bacterium]
MHTLLHIVATPREDQSRTLQVSREFVSELQAKYTKLRIDTLNVFTESLPDLTVQRIAGKSMLMAGKELSKPLEEPWKPIECHIQRFISADMYLLSSPMWNFSIPYRLKQYLDVIIQPRYLFRYGLNGPEGLVRGKKMLVIASRGGDYSPESPIHSYDFQEPYLRTVFGFIGITDVQFICIQPVDARGPEVASQRIADAKKKAVSIAENWQP